ncbi:MAG: NADH-quinone oxidoreductase subunit D [Gaiellaceae bacterium]|jgi:NADH-quinone oxidoreductase subunit D
MAIAGDAVFSGPALYEGTRIPTPVPSWVQVDPARREEGNVLEVNFGPNHPSTHGVLRLVVDLDGEEIVGMRAVVGYLHTGFEKNMEQKSWWKAINYPSRIDYLSSFQNELLFVLAIEKLLEIEVPAKATWIRTALAELNRIHSHLVWMGTMGLELGIQAMYMYCFDQRERVLDLFEMVTGVRVHGRYCQAGGLAEDVPPGFVPDARAFCRQFAKAVEDYAQLTEANKIWLIRTQGVGVISAEDAIRLGLSGPNLRASGVHWDLRKREPYLFYNQVDFDVPVYEHGDSYDRSRVRIDEMRQSIRITAQCLDRIAELEGEPWIADDRKVVLPPREELHTSMESLIHHFKIVTEGYRVPAGEIYVTIESPRGEQGCYVVSDGGPRPWRVHFRAPSFLTVASAPTMCQGHLIADLIAISASLDPLMGDCDR